MVDNVSKPFTFIANTYAKASEVNADFDALYAGLNSTINQVNTNTNSITTVGSSKADKVGDSTQTFNVANPVNDANAVNLATLKAMYPVGSIYIGTMEECPIASIFGTWELVSEGRVLQGADEDHNTGTTIAAGLPNIVGNLPAANLYPYGEGSEAFLSTNKGSYGGGANGQGYKHVNFNASRYNSIYSDDVDTVQPPAYVVNIWERTA